MPVSNHISLYVLWEYVVFLKYLRLRMDSQTGNPDHICLVTIASAAQMLCWTSVNPGLLQLASGIRRCQALFVSNKKYLLIFIASIKRRR